MPYKPPTISIYNEKKKKETINKQPLSLLMTMPAYPFHRGFPHLERLFVFLLTLPCSWWLSSFSVSSSPNPLRKLIHHLKVFILLVVPTMPVQFVTSLVLRCIRPRLMVTTNAKAVSPNALRIQGSRPLSCSLIPEQVLGGPLIQLHAF